MEIEFSSEIQKIASLNSHQTVKVAGILSRLKKWFKAWRDPSFRADINLLETKSQETKELISLLSQSIELTNEAIENGDLSSYELYFDKLKQLAVRLIGEIKDTQKTINDSAAKQYQRKNLYYSDEDIKEPDFKERFQKALPADFDVELNTIQAKPLKSFKYYSKVTPDWISFSEKTKTVFFNKLSEKGIDIPIENQNSFIEEVKKSILDGNLIEAKYRTKSSPKQNKNQSLGTVELAVSSAPILVPSGAVQANFILIDLSTSVDRAPKLSVALTLNLKKIKSSSRLEKLQKIAAELALKYTTVDKLQFAEILKKGYQLAFGKEPSLEVLGVGWAQGVLETGEPIHLPDNNIGNIKADSSWLQDHDYFVKSTIEYDKNKNPYHEQDTKWRAYATPEEGAAAYWLFLKNQMPEVFSLMSSGDAVGAATYMGEHHYYTVSIDKYSNAMGSRYKEFMSSIAPHLTLNNKEDDIEVSLPEPSNDNGLQQLMQQLVAFPLTQKIKTSLENPNQYLIRIEAANTILQREFAKKLAFHLQKYLDGVTQIKGNEYITELQVKIAGDIVYNHNKINEITSQLKTALNNNLDVIIAPNLHSDLPALSQTKLAQNSQLFNKFSKVLYG